MRAYTRKCTRTFHIRMTEKEYQTLCRKAERTKLPKSTNIRFMIEGSCPKEHPSDEFYDLLHIQLHGISNNLNQIARKAHAFGFIDEPMYRREAEKWSKFCSDFYSRSVLPEKMDIKVTVERRRQIIENEQEDGI